MNRASVHSQKNKSATDRIKVFSGFFENIQQQT